MSAASPLRSIYGDAAGALARVVREMAVDYGSFAALLRPCELSRCRATCCHDGVHLSRGEAEMMAHFTGDDGLVERTGRGWKTQTRQAAAGELAEDYPEHFPRTRCVLLDGEGRCCLQMQAVTDGRHPWDYKPLTCWLHPLVIDQSGERPVLRVFSAENDPQAVPGYPGFASCTHCGRTDAGGVPAHEALEQELRTLGELGGRDLVAEIRA